MHEDSLERPFRSNVATPELEVGRSALTETNLFLEENMCFIDIISKAWQA